MQTPGRKQPGVSYSFLHHVSDGLLQSNIPGYEGFITLEISNKRCSSSGCASHYLLGKTAIDLNSWEWKLWPPLQKCWWFLKRQWDMQFLWAITTCYSGLIRWSEGKEPSDLEEKMMFAKWKLSRLALVFVCPLACSYCLWDTKDLSLAVCRLNYDLIYVYYVTHQETLLESPFLVYSRIMDFSFPAQISRVFCKSPWRTGAEKPDT